MNISSRADEFPRGPWEAVGDVQFPVRLGKIDPVGLDDLIDMPRGSALTVARVNPDGTLVSADWRGTGEWGFYPASIVKFTTAAMTLQFLDRHGLAIDDVLHVGDDMAMTFRELLAETIVMSGNDTFNTLQEAMGFAETYAEMQRWGVVQARIRRHFRSPRYNHSRGVVVTGPKGEERLRMSPRPPADVPFHDGNAGKVWGVRGPRGFSAAQPASTDNVQSNWWCTDDLVRALAAIMFSPTRRTRHFAEVMGWASFTNQNRLRDGLRALTASHPRHPPFVTVNKPGWWPPDGVNVEMGYVYDVEQDRHYLVGMYYQGEFQASAVGMARATRLLFEWLRAGGLDRR